MGSAGNTLREMPEGPGIIRNLEMAGPPGPGSRRPGPPGDAACAWLPWGVPAPALACVSPAPAHLLRVGKYAWTLHRAEDKADSPGRLIIRPSWKV